MRHRRKIPVKHLDDQRGTQIGEPVKQIHRCILRADRHRFGQQRRPGVEPLIHLHDGHAGLRIPRKNRGMDRRGSTPARQQTRVDIDAAASRGDQHVRWKNLSIGGDDCGIEVERAEIGPLGIVPAQALRRPHRQAERLRSLMNRAFVNAMAPPDRSRRLAIDRDDIMARRMQRPQRRHRESRRSHERETHQRAGFRAAFSRRSFASLRRIMFRLSADR